MRTDHARRRLESLIDEEAEESFPASDPPSWSGMHIGSPCPDEAEVHAPRTDDGVEERREVE